ncbi:MAG: HAMP domain-containing sensor histidine kinase [Chthoniobacteraceae bacterium]
MKHWTLRLRLAFWSVLFFAAAVVLMGAFTLLLVRRQQVRALDFELLAESRAVFHELAEHGPAGVAHGIFLLDKSTRWVVLGPDGQTLSFSPDLRVEDFAQAVSGAQTVGAWRVVAATENGYTVRLARDFSDVDSTVADVRRAYLLTLPILLLFVGGGAWWFVRSALQPVREISAAAERISSEHLDGRLPLPARRDELGQLTNILNQMLDRLERGHTQAVRFTADASHELKTPLALIAAGLEELLRRRDLAPEVITTLRSLLEDNRRLGAVCQDLLVLARADAGSLALDRDLHDLRALTEAAVEDARILGEGDELAFEVELPAHAEELVDARYFTRILLNLLSNAVKYNHQRGCVRVELTMEDERWSLTIGNTGPGIAPEFQPRLFERFFRVDNSALVPGHGLGLSLSRELARAHGGDLAMIGSCAEWTIFHLTLPRLAEEAAPPFAVAEERMDSPSFASALADAAS